MELMKCGWKAGGYKVILGKANFSSSKNESDYNHGVVCVHNKLAALCCVIGP